MAITFALIVCLITGSLTTVCVGQTPGSLDTTFDVRVQGVERMYVQTIQAIALQPDGKILIGGDFTNVNGVTAIDVARLNPDGSLDLGFKVEGGTLIHQGLPSGVRAISVDANGKILVGGSFDQIGGVARTNLARLHPDGSVDTSFVMPPEALSYVEKIARIGDGTVDPAYVVSDGEDRRAVFLNRDGSFNRAFNPQTDQYILTPRQRSGKPIVVWENFNYFKELKRLNLDGTIDPTFQNSSNFFLRSPIAVQPNDRVLTQPVHSSGVGPVIRLQRDGELDPTFHPVMLDASASAFLTQPDGKILMVGYFTNVNGALRQGIARVYGDASGPPIVLGPPPESQTYMGQTARFEIDFSSASPVRFQWQYQGQDIPGATDQTLEIPNVQITQSGEYRVKVQNEVGTTISGPSWLTVFGMAAGALDTSFSGSRIFDGAVFSLLEQPDGKLLVGGSFTNVAGSRHSGIARLLVDGNVDAAFNVGTGVAGGTNAHIRAIARQADGRILIGGQFKEVSGITLGGIGRLLENGMVDATFRSTPDPGTNRLVKSLAVQTNGQVLVGGTFQYTTNAPVSYRHLVRLNENGSLDLSYAPSPHGGGCHYIYCWDYSAVNALLIRPDGKVLVGGGFYGTTLAPKQRGLLLLHHNGGTDTNFYANMTLHNMSQLDTGVPILNDVIEQPDGKLIVVGNFSYYPTRLTDFLIHKLDRLNSDGSRDTNFTSHLVEKDLDGEFLTAALQPDGKILVGGSFKTIKGVKRNKIARFNADGSLDLLFDVGEGPDGPVHAIEVMKDGSIVIGGAFTRVNGIEQRGLARLFAHTDALPINAQPTMKADGLEITWNTEAGKSYLLETTTSLSSPQWSLVTNVTGDGALKTFKDESRTHSQQYYRLRLSSK